MKTRLVWKLTVLSLLFVATSTTPVKAGDACNLLSNPGFDEDGGSLAGWVAFGNAFASDAVSQSAPASAQMFGLFTGGFNVTGILQTFESSPDQSYTMSGWSQVLSSDPLIGGGPPLDNWAVMKISFFDAPDGGNEIGSNEVIIADGTTPQDQWLFNSVSATAPGETQRVEALFLFLQPCPGGDCAAGSVFVDDASFVLEGSDACDDGDPCTEDDTCIEGQCIGTPIECPEGESCVDGQCAPPAPETCNLLSNPGFDANGGSFDGWFTFGNAFINAPDEVFRSAPGAGKMFGNFNGGFNVTGILQAFAAAAGETYFMTGWSHVRSADPLIGEGPPGDNWAVMKIAFFDAPAGGNEIGSSEAIIADGTTPQDVWRFHDVSATAPDGTQRVEALFLFLQPAFDPGAVFVDDATFGLEVQCENERSLAIKQDACPAPLNPNSNGVIPVVLAGDADFDVSEVVLESLNLHLCGGSVDGIAPLNGPPGPPITIDDLNHASGEGVVCSDEPCACDGDYTPDGIGDLVLKFSTNEFVDAFEDLDPGSVLPLELSGVLTDGTSFFGRDCVMIVPPDGLAPVNVNVQSNLQGTYITVFPWDLNIDGDGFANFGRSYNEGTMISLSAPPVSQGRSFRHWVIDGISASGATEIDVFAIEDTTIRAVYRHRNRINPSALPDKLEEPGQSGF